MSEVYTPGDGGQQGEANFDEKLGVFRAASRKLDQVPAWRMLGRVTRIAEKTTGYGSTKTLVGVRVDVDCRVLEGEDEIGYTGAIEIPLAWIPPNLRVGSTVRLSIDVERGRPVLEEKGEEPDGA